MSIREESSHSKLSASTPGARRARILIRAGSGPRRSNVAHPAYIVILEVKGHRTISAETTNHCAAGVYGAFNAPSCYVESTCDTTQAGLPEAAGGI